MEIIHVSNNLNTNEKIIATIGEFDGLHKGHVSLIKRCIELSKTNNCKSGLICFYPHPDYVLKKRKYEAYLTDLDEKIKMLEDYNIDYLYIVNCDIELLKLEKEEFYDKFLKSFYGLVVGFDFHFGYLGKGDSAYLQYLFKNKLFSIIEQESFLDINDELKKISSNSIRAFLELGNVEMANQLLGYAYNFTGVVEDGKKVGRTYGFPTANIMINNEKFIPRNGVYVCNIIIDNDKYQGICNIGKNPSIDALAEARLEVNIFDFNLNIYQKKIKVELLKFIRDELVFANIDDLSLQIEKDKEKAINFFRGNL